MQLSSRPRPSAPASEATPPSPDLLPIALRLAVIVGLALTSQLDRLRAWGAALRAPATSITPDPQAVPDPAAVLAERLATLGRHAGADILGILTHPPATTVITGIAITGGVLLLAELIWGLLALVFPRRRRPGAATYLSVRPPFAAGRSAGAPDPQNFWVSLQPAAAAADAEGAPVAMTLHATPDQPAQLAVWIDGATPASAVIEKPAPQPTVRRRADRPTDQQGGRRTLRPIPGPKEAPAGDGLARAIVAAIQGVTPGCEVAPRPDPLAAALTPGRLLAWQECRLALPAAAPLRGPAEAGALLIGLAAAMRPPAGVVATEVQVVVQPHDESPDTAWRVRGRRCAAKMRLQRTGGGDEAGAIEEKANSPRIDVTIRLVAVADNADRRAAAASAIAAMGRALAPLQARSGRRFQRLVPAGLLPARAAVLATPTRPSWSAVLPGAALALAAIVAVIAAGAPAVLAVLAAALVATLAAGLALAAQYEIARVISRAPRLSPPALLSPWRLWAPPAILSLLETAAVWTIPALVVGGPLAGQPNRLIPPPAHLLAPAGATDWLALGWARRGDGVRALIGLPLRALRQLLHLTAGVGAGKSQFLANIFQQLIPWGVFVIDGKGDDRQGSLVATVRALIPLADEQRVAILDPLDSEWPIALNPLHGIDARDPAALTQGLGTMLSILARLDPNWSESVGMQQYGQMAGALVLEAEPTPTLATFKQALQDEAYRNRLLERCHNIEVLTFWQTTFPKTSTQQKNSLDALLRRLDNVLVSELTRYLLTIPTPTIDMGAAMEDGAIVLMPIPHNTLGELSNFVAMLSFYAVVRAAYRRGGTDQTRATVPVLIDELQVLIGRGDSADLQAAISQLRALGIGLVLAHQALDQLGGLRDELLQNASNRVILRAGEPDASVYARMYAGHDLRATDISGQPPAQHQYLVALGADRTPYIASMEPLPWPEPVDATPAPTSAQSWQGVLPRSIAPVDMPMSDAELVALIYQPTDVAAHAATLARLPEAAWQAVLMRWDAIRAAQRAFIVAHPGCVPDRLERQRWLSRLRWAMPRVLAAAWYQRQRWAISPGEAPAPVGPRAPSTPPAPPRGGPRPASTAVVPGLAPNHPPAAPTAPPTAPPTDEFAGLDDEA